MKIQVINRKDNKKAAIIGPVFNVMRGTALGNRFNITKKRNREKAIAAYKRELWTHIQNKTPGIINALAEIKRTADHNERIFLSCCCHPKDCHADIIKACVLWAAGHSTKSK
jgi:hypothetical protein